MKPHEQKKIERPFISLEEACEFLSIAKSTMYQKTFLKTIPFYKMNRKILFKVSELKDYVESHRVKTQSEIETEAMTNLVTGK